MISTNEAAYMADAFRKALRKPDFADRPQAQPLDLASKDIDADRRPLLIGRDPAGDLNFEELVRDRRERATGKRDWLPHAKA